MLEKNYKSYQFPPKETEQSQVSFVHFPLKETVSRIHNQSMPFPGIMALSYPSCQCLPWKPRVLLCFGSCLTQTQQLTLAVAQK
jgi:hypothetical protein